LKEEITDDRVCDKILENIELYLRRNHSKGGHPAIVYDLEENKFNFITLTKRKG
jgi:hypothetical protein